MVGKNLSHYKILEELGRGGMGIVYKAEDTKLDRTVAIKVLPSAALASEEDRARFYREAKAAAALTHPNIAIVHTVDEAVPEGAKDDDLRPFIAMEYIDGETLSDRIQKGPLKLEEAVRIASQIASGLEAAHEKDIVHRDLKSQNVMLTAKGEAKILDFGLAQTAASTKLTRMGSTLGTVAYMSPEQAQGSAVDNRTDIWSLGVVLYEMITGTSPFPGEYDKAVIYNILNQDPEPLTGLRTGVPMELERIAFKCLAKDPSFRFQHADELQADLRALKVESVIGSKTHSTVHHPLSGSAKENHPIRQVVILLTVAALLVAATWVVAISQSSPMAEQLSSATTLTLEDADGNVLRGYDPNRGLIAISSDGSTIAFNVLEAAGFRLHLRSIDEFETRPVQGSEGGYTPAFSPNGEWLAYCDDSAIWKVRVVGGLPERVTGIEGRVRCTGLAWLRDDRLLFVPGWTSGIYSVAADGSDRRLLIEPDSSQFEASYRYPRPLPDGSGFFFIIRRDDIEFADEAYIAFFDIQTNEISVLIRGGSYPVPLDESHLVFSRRDGIYATTFDRQTLTTGKQVLVVEDVPLTVHQYGRFDVAQNGTIVYGPDRGTTRRTLSIISRDSVVNLPPPFTAVLDMTLSPDNTKLLAYLEGPWEFVYQLDLVTLDWRKLTHRGNNHGSDWKPDGLAFSMWSDINRTPGIYSQDINSEEPKLLLATTGISYVGNWTPDGKTIVYSAQDSTGDNDIWMINVEDTTSPTVVVSSFFDERDPLLSPDGQNVAYFSNETGVNAIFIADFPSGLNKYRISQGEVRSEFKWSRDSRTLFYETNERKLMMADLTRLPTRSKLVDWMVDYRPQEFDVFSSGDRFLVYETKRTGDPSNVFDIKIRTNFDEYVAAILSN